MSGAPYPWQAEQWQRLTRDMTRLPHALLLAGIAGLGKNRFALALAQRLLCSDAKGETAACGDCAGCKLFAAGTHPDLHVLQPECDVVDVEGTLPQYALRYLGERPKGRKTKSVIISIDQVRALINNLQTRAHQGARKVAIVIPAEAMNVNAANSLLKLLEEPPGDTVLLLASSHPDRLLATVNSRCRRLDFSVPERTAALAWLAAVLPETPATEHTRLLDLCGGAPLAAEQGAARGMLAEQEHFRADLAALAQGQGDPVASAARWAKVGAIQALDWLQRWLVDLARVGTAGTPPALFNPDATPELHNMVKRIELNDIYRFFEAVSEARRQAGGVLDETLLLEDLLISWTTLSLRGKT